ncbi:MAG TPA: hypothetical protein VNV88_10725 [Candidatus Solibacter sp.]|jgi:hypothetical protein|nr:hypothetical protein [Candidatus Solibacter sp.]
MKLFSEMQGKTGYFHFARWFASTKKGIVDDRRYKSDIVLDKSAARVCDDHLKSFFIAVAVKIKGTSLSIAEKVFLAQRFLFQGLKLG